jgi:hypothetical protein
MCASTYQGVRERFPEAEQLHLQLKGKEAPVEGFRLRLAR